MFHSDGKFGDTPGAVKQINCVLLALNSKYPIFLEVGHYFEVHRPTFSEQIVIETKLLWGQRNKLLQGKSFLKCHFHLYHIKPED